jgi:uncharacterized protein YbjT (DUF2867 family)
MKSIFITGGTGYIGGYLIAQLIAKGYHVKALVRNQSAHKLPAGVEIIKGDALNAASYQHHISPCQMMIHLVGVSHPSPAKKAQFYSIDLVAAQQAALAARHAMVSEFVMMSVAQESTKIMADYQQARAQAESYVNDLLPNTLFVRPWYVVGPGHYWPLLLTPIYKILSWLPFTQRKANALALVTINQLIAAMVDSIEKPAKGHYTLEISEIKKYPSHTK